MAIHDFPRSMWLIGSVYKEKVFFFYTFRYYYCIRAVQGTTCYTMCFPLTDSNHDLVNCPLLLRIS